MVYLGEKKEKFKWCILLRTFFSNIEAVRESETSRGVGESETMEITRPPSLTLDYRLSLLKEKLISFSYSLLC